MIKAIAELFTEVFRFFVNKSKAGEKAVQIAEMYDRMQEILSAQGINHILILWYHNSGGNISADRPLYVTCIHEVKVDEIDSVKRRYKGMEVDVPYAKLMAEVYVQGQIDVNFNTMKSGILKRIYFDEDVLKSRICFLKHNKQGLWYIAFRSSNQDYDFSEDEVSIRGITSHVKRVL